MQRVNKRRVRKKIPFSYYHYRSFYTVQGPVDIARLRDDGIPWPTETNRSGLGEGVYAWTNQSDAQQYLAVRSRQVPDLKIVTFWVSIEDLLDFKQLDVDSLPAPEEWMSRYSKIWGGVPDHGLEYIRRETSMGKEHFFDQSIFDKLKFGRARKSE